MKRIALGPYLFLFLVLVMIIGLLWLVSHPIYFLILIIIFLTFLILNSKPHGRAE